MKSDNFAWFMNSILTFMFVMAWVSWYSLHRPVPLTQGQITGSVEACLGAHCFEDEPVAKPKPKPVHVITAPKLFRTYRINQVIQVSRRDLECLSRNIYYESRGESMAGKIAVAQVTWNRVRTKRWGETFCSVVYAPHQFSWTFQDVRFRLPSGPEWTASRHAAVAFLRGDRVAKLGRSDHYHARRVDPRWNRSMQAKGVVGQHIFYASNQ